VHNDELHSLSSSLNIVREDEVGGTCSTPGRGVYRISVGKPEGKRQLGRLRGKIIFKWTLRR
jgi:hypothetical protein